jgi:hypothetical protein
MVRELASLRVEAYMRLYGQLAGVRPPDDSIATEVRKRLDRDLTYWYHEVSGA